MEPLEILLVAGNAGAAFLVNMILTKTNQTGLGRRFATTQVETLSQALDVLTEDRFEVVLLDLALPDSQGLATLHALLAAAPVLPVIVMSNLSDQTVALEAVKAGAQDYLAKAYINEYSLPRAIYYAIERQRAELALRQSETKLRTLFNLLPIGISILNQEREVLHANPALEKLLGLSHQDLRRRHHQQRTYLRTDGTPMPPAEFPSTRALAENRVIEDVEIGIITETGERLWTSVSAAPVDFPDWRVVTATTDITRRKWVEESLWQSEAFTRAVLNSLKAHIAVLDQSGVIIAVNQAWEQFARDNGDPTLQHTGVGTNYFEVCRRAMGEDALVAQAVLAGIQAVAAGTQAEFNLEYPCHSPHEKRWFVLRVTPLLDGHGRVVVAHENNSERVQAQEKLQQRNRELALLNQVIAASVNTLESEAILEVACRELALAFDVPQVAAVLFDEYKTEAVVVTEYLGQNQLSALQQRIPIKDNLALARLLGRRKPLVINDARRDPRLAPLRELVQRYRAASLLILPLVVDEELVGVLALKDLQADRFAPEEVSLAWSVADQIAGVLARVRLGQLHQRLSAAIEQAAEAVAITDVAARIIYVNPAFERITGYSRAEVLGQNSRLLNSGRQSQAFYANLWATITAGQVWNGRLVNQRKDGSLYTEEMTITPIRNNSGQITNYVTIKNDVTTKLHLEEQLRQSQKMEAIGRLAGGIAHDFNNLLTVITGYSEFLLARYLASENLPHKEIEQISRAGERAAALTRQLLAFSRKQALEPRRLNLNTVITDLEKMLHRLIGEDIELTTTLAPDLGQTLVDPGQLEQVIMNLVINARDAMPDGGKLTIETANVYLDEIYALEHSEVQPGPYVMVAVSDTGVGMDKATLLHIFEPFFTTKAQGQGTGLGLATVYGIVKQSNGSIWAYSEPGYGSTFKIYLPRIPAPAEPLEAKPTPAPLQRGSETILMVEDETSVRQLMRTVLETNGYTVLEATDPQEALELCRQYLQPIHLLLTDIIMPGLNGHKLAEQLILLRPNLKTLFISGYTGNAIINQEMLEAGQAFLEKPFTPRVLLGKVRKVLDGEK